MAKSRSRGGYQKPNKPAAVSGPGALSQRTDGNQPVVPMPDLPYGQQQALMEQQRQAPLGDSGGANAPYPMGRQGTSPDVFAPTELPGEPITAGVPTGEGPGPAPQIQNQTDMLLAAMYEINPHPIIAELINTKSP
tara:strand:+ start:269 stop:676 length:408 start_codon:yes stop_codon:yes gene_type:complete